MLHVEDEMAMPRTDQARPRMKGHMSPIRFDRWIADMCSSAREIFISALELNISACEIYSSAREIFISALGAKYLGL